MAKKTLDLQSKLRTGTREVVDFARAVSTFTWYLRDDDNCDCHRCVMGVRWSLTFALRRWDSCRKAFPSDLEQYYSAAFLEMCRSLQIESSPRFWGWFFGGYSPNYHVAAFRWLDRKLTRLTDVGDALIRELYSSDDDAFYAEWMAQRPFIQQLLGDLRDANHEPISMIAMEGLQAILIYEQGVMLDSDTCQTPKETAQTTKPTTKDKILAAVNEGRIDQRNLEGLKEESGAKNVRVVSVILSNLRKKKRIQAASKPQG